MCKLPRIRRFMRFRQGSIGDGAAAPGRRSFLGSGLAFVAANTAAARLASRALAAPATTGSQPADVTVEKFSAAGVSEGMEHLPKVVKSDAEWRAQLSPLGFQVTREQGTEAPYSGEYSRTHTDGVYRCVCCETALYDSKTKFESGTGWPSFWKPISTVNVVKSADSSFGMERDAISCRLCDAHLGHVFTDGPKPTGLRYCMNSVSLHFVPRT